MNSTQAQDELFRLRINPDAYNDTLLSAERKGEVSTLALLIAAGADVNTVDKNGKTPLFWAITKNHPECAERIRAAGGKE